ncbi:MAG: insulinase family protein [Acidobacteriota bacterium]|nr:insulinase family protein [Acidobacteriota bacterium]MDH3784342.1 insulinase family protein [Acidobacteriota bacterium]
MTNRASRWLPTIVIACMAIVSAIGIGHAAGEAKVPVEILELDNGMKFLLVPRTDKTTVAAGWVAHVGSANERPGITGISHLFEHMLFKGTTTIGTTDIERDLEIIEEQERLQEQIRLIYRDQRERWRRGEIEDPFAPENRTEEQIKLEEQFQALVEEQRSIMIKDEFDKIYTKAGATGMNAGTTNDLTLYFITVPANKLELWFWMESDRLSSPVMREFYSERDVVYEERRLRTESTPTGEFDEQFESMFWQSHPYNWPVVGWPSDLRVISKQEADEYFSTYYAANNLTAALVGNFDVNEVKKLANKYFGRLPNRGAKAPDVVTLEMEQKAEKRMQAECDCQPQVEVRYHTVPFMHADSYALDVLAGLLNGRTGRLYKSMVLDSEIAASAFAGQDSRKYGGAFSFGAQTKGDATPQQLEDGWYAQLRKIVEEPIPAEELQKVKNGIAADAYRNLENPFFLALQLMFYDGLGDWEYMNVWSDLTLAVTAEDVKRVAEKYFAEDNRAVAQYYRKAGSGGDEEFPELAELEPELQGPLRQQLKQLKSMGDPEQLTTILGQIEQQKTQAPPPMARAFEIMESYIRARIEELRSEEGSEQ